MSDTTTSFPSKEKKVFKQCKINDFEAMIAETLGALDKVLEQRTKDLNLWGEKEQRDFLNIFGWEGNEVVHVDMPVRGVSNLVEMTAKEVIFDCVERISYVRGTMTVSSFLNRIDSAREVCASVKGEPQDNYEVEIGINFVGRRNRNNGKDRICMSITGRDSRVSTLCHELSHIPKQYASPKDGGIGASDYDSKGIKKSPYKDDMESYEQHVAGANLLIFNKSECVFDNAYNLERYFEIDI